MNKKLSKELIKTLDNTFNRLLELSLNSSLSDEFFLNEWSKNRIILKDFLADEIAGAREEVLEGFIKWEFIDDGDTERTDMLKEAKQYLKELNNEPNK